MFSSPAEAYQNAVMKGDVDAAASTLPRLKEAYGPSRELAVAAAMVAKTENHIAGEILLSMLEENYDDLDAYVINGVIGGATWYFVANKQHKEGIARLEVYIRKLSKTPDISDEEKGSTLNYLQMLLYGAERYEEALSVCDEVLKYCPESPSYYYNASLINEHLGLIKKAIEAIEKCIELKDEDQEQHLSQALDLYEKDGQEEKYQSTLDQLRSINPIRASLKEL